MPGPKTVLIVDDESGMRALISRLLRDRNFQLLQAENGQQALELLGGGQHVDLMLLDVMMPEMNGYELLHTMEQEGLNKDVFVIMLTALKALPDVMKGYNVGAHYYITKPFTEKTLLNIVDYLIGDIPPEEKSRLELLL